MKEFFLLIVRVLEIGVYGISQASNFKRKGCVIHTYARAIR